eukprot:jgi/Tetstr1/437867/TSEL_026507.t1
MGSRPAGKRRGPGAGPTCALEVDIRAVRDDKELWAAAWLRAVAFAPPDTPMDMLTVTAKEDYQALRGLQTSRTLGTAFTGASGGVGKQQVDSIIALAPASRLQGIDASMLIGNDLSRKAVVGTMDVVAMITATEDQPLQDCGVVLPAMRLEPVAYMANLCVHPSARRQAIGAQLIDYARCLAVLWGAEVLLVEVEARNAQGLGLYLGYGF